MTWSLFSWPLIFLLWFNRRRKGRSPLRVPLPLRLRVVNTSFRPQKTSQYSTSPKHSSPLAGYDTYEATAPPASSSRSNQVFYLFVRIWLISKFLCTCLWKYVDLTGIPVEWLGVDALFSFWQECPICLTNPKDMAFGCGHQVRIQANFLSGSVIVNSHLRIAWLNYYFGCIRYDLGS